MPVQRLVFDVEYADPDPREWRVRVILSDRLMTETHGRKYGLMDSKAQPQLTGALWLYYASRREGHIGEAVEFAEFQKLCLGDTRVADEPVDPTTESSGSRSDSPSDSPVTTGSNESAPETTD